MAWFHKPEPDGVLLRRTAEGDTAAFESLYRRYAAKLLHFVTGLLKDPQRAEDVVQNVFTRLFLYRKQSLVRVLGAVAVHQFVLSLLLNTLWISLLYGSPFGPLLVSRLPQCALLTAVQVVVIQALVRLMPQLKRSIS